VGDALGAPVEFMSWEEIAAHDLYRSATDPSWGDERYADW
jgi:ADP-ribosylglycohydrolase